MARFDTLDDATAARIASALQRFVSVRAGETASLQFSMSIVRVRPAALVGAEPPTRPAGEPGRDLLRDSGFWYHQIESAGRPIAHAVSRGVPPAGRSPSVVAYSDRPWLARVIADGVARVDPLTVAGRIPDDARVRLLHAPTVLSRALLIASGPVERPQEVFLPLHVRGATAENGGLQGASADLMSRADVLRLFDVRPAFAAFP